jgi:hypothetical protein
MGRVFVLGAGASKFAGYPLGLDLWSFIRQDWRSDYASEKRRRAVVHEVEQILKVYPLAQPDRPNLEELFTLLDLVDLGTFPLGIKLANWKELRTMLMGVVADAFLCHQYDLQSGKVGIADLQKVLECWGKLVREDDTIISFNWDILHEAALWKAKKWHFADGYGFVCADAPPGARSSVKILKLHGSANWAQRDEQDCEPAIEYKADFFPGAPDDHEKTYAKGAAQSNEGRNLIVPSYLKDLSSNRLLLCLWNQAFEALAESTEVIVIGFQLHPADAPARQLFGTALLINKQISTVSVVTPSDGPDNWDSFCFHLGKVRRIVRVRFEDWVSFQTH